MRFSIVTICRNDTDGLFSTLRSIRSQDLDDYELIVVDGFSSDASVKILEDFDDQIDRWTSEPDGGIYEAMGRASALARGDYLLFMNAGDEFFDAEVLTAANGVIEREAPQLFHGQAYSRIDGRRLPYNEHLWQGMVCSHQSLFARRDLVLAHPFAGDFRIAADYRFIVECVHAGAALLSTGINVARIDPGGVSGTSFHDRTIERLRVCHEFYRNAETYAHFAELLGEKGLDMPDWAATEEVWLHGA